MPITLTQVHRRVQSLVTRPELADRFIYGLTFCICLTFFFSWSKYYSPDSILPLDLQLKNHDWSSWAGIFWSHTELIFIAGIGVSAYGIYRGGYWPVSLALAFIMSLIFHRNILIVDLGDSFFIMLLLWHAVIVSAEGKSFRIVRMGFIFQIAMIYIQNGFLRFVPIWTEWGTALNLLYGNPGLAHEWILPAAGWNLTLLTRLLPEIELAFGIMLFTSWRKWAVIFFIIYHIIASLTINVGFYHPIMFATWILFLSLDLRSDGEKKWSISSAIAWLWMVSISIQSVVYLSGERFPDKVEHNLMLYYQLQVWPMFVHARNKTPIYSFQCRASGREIPCGADIEHLANRRKWDDREAGLMDKLAMRSYVAFAKQPFHQYLCKLQPAADEIIVKLSVKEIDPRTLAVRGYIPVDFGVDPKCEVKK